MKCNFVVGQKVTPIKRELSEYEKEGARSAKEAGVIFPKVGETYTIRDIRIARMSNGEDVAIIRLFEIKNKPDMKFKTGFVGEIGFFAACFRPVVERKTDISIFKAMLNPSRQTVDA